MPGKEIVPRPLELPAAITTPPWARGKPETVTAWKWLRRRHHWTLPAFLPLPVWLSGFALHHYGLASYVALLGAALTATVALFSAAKWDRAAERWYAIASMAALSGWLLAAAWAGPAGLGQVIALLALDAAWGLAWWAHKRPRGQRKRQKKIAKWDAWWQSHCWHWNLGGSKVTDVHEMGVTTKVRVHGLAGRHSIQHVRQVMHLIESGLDGYADIGLVRAEPAGGHPNWFDFYFKRANPLAQVVEYDPALAPRSVTEDAVIGVTETGASRAASQRVNKFVIGQTRWGKALALNTPIPTPDGWAAIGDLKPGDAVFDETGNPCRVTGAWEVRYGRPCYEVEFSDGSVIVADAEHQWLVTTRLTRKMESQRRCDSRRRKTSIKRLRASRQIGPEVVTTEAMAQSVRAVDGHANYAIPVAAPLQCPAALLPVPPYTLGAWLGDGATATGSVTTADPEIIAEIEAEGETVWAIPSTIRERHASYRISGLNVRLRQIGVLGNKHIPSVYMRASESQRRALLAGLLDTDGYCKDRGTAQYCSTSERLARDVQQLAVTLGYRVTIRSKAARLYGKDCGQAWTVAFTPADKVFRLSRKVAGQIVGDGRHRFIGQRYITAVRRVPSVPVRCISVDSASHLYLAGESCIPTHNSNLLSVDLAALTGCPDSRQILIDIGGGRSCRPWLGAVDCAATGIDEARQVLRMLNDEVQARRRGAYFGEEQVTPSPACPAIHLLIDEVHALTSVPNGDAECARLLALIASQGNAVAVYVEVFTQHGSLEESVRTEQTRANLPFRVAFRVAEARHGAYAIPEYAKLDASRLEEKGTCYIKDGPDASPEQVRTCHMPHELVRRIAAQPHHAALNRPPLVLYAQQWQEWWDTRWSRLDPVFAADCPQYQVLAAATPAQAVTAAQQASASAGPVPAAPGEGDGKAAAARITAELDATYAGLPSGTPIPPVKNLGTMVARQKDHFAAALQTAPPGGIAPAQLVAESGMSRAWVHSMLGALLEAGAVTQPARGRYRPVPGADIRQAMSAVKAAGDQLYREAKAAVNAA